MSLIHIFLFLIAFSSCSLKKVALRSATPIFSGSSETVMREANWDFFREASPGNLKFMEVLWEQDKENLALLSVLIKSYAGYSFAVPETLAFEDELAGIENSRWKNDAIFFYTRSLDYGIRYLKHKGITSEEILSDEKRFLKKLKTLQKNDVMALLYTAQSWASLINLQKDNVALIANVSKVKMMFDRVCELSPDVDGNICDIFYAQYESSRPKVLGGNPEYGEKLFQEAIRKNPRNLLIRMSYIQSLILPSMDLEKYERESAILKKEINLWEDMNRDNLENLSPYKKFQDLNLFNSIAKKRFDILEKYKNKIF